MKQKKILRLFTTYFPGGKYEVYMENEIIALAEKFDHIYIYPLKNSENHRSIPENCTVVNPNSVKSVSNFTLFCYYPFLVFKLFFKQIVDKGWATTFKNKSFLRQYLFAQLNLFHYFKNDFSINKNDVYYSNWFVDWSLCLSILKDKNSISDFTVRTHRYDLYDKEYPIGFIPFRKYQTRLVTSVASISQDGINYLSKNNPDLQSKLFLFRLGSKDRGINPVNTHSKLRIVTCSNLKPVKRLHLLVEALMNCKSSIDWHHFGDGELKDNLIKQTQKLPRNIQFTLHGRIPSVDLYRFYRENPIDCLVNLSASEGIPVSIMEAVSFGIPVIATNVGGTSEIINPQTGILLDENFNIDELTNILDDFSLSDYRKVESRKSVRAFWMTNFNAEKCFPEFADFLVSKRKELNNV